MIGRRYHAQGFTLIELMLSVAIMTSMLTLVWGSFSLTARNRSGAEAISDRYHQIRLTMNRIARELSMAYLSKNDQVGAQIPRTLFVCERGRQADELTFSALSNMPMHANARQSEQTMISYFVKDDPIDSERRHLWRRASRRLGTIRGEEPGEVGPAYVMLEDIEEIHYEFFDEVANEWRERWSTRSVDGQPDRLPEKVRILLTVLDERGRELELTTSTRIFLRDPIWFSVSE